MEKSELNRVDDDQLKACVSISKNEEEGSEVVTESFEEEALRNQLIVERLLTFLPLDSLKILRQVSSSFNRHTTKSMYSRYYLKLSHQLFRQDDHLLEEFLSKYADHVKFRNIKISSSYRDNSRGILDILPHVHLYGDHVRTLIYDVTPYQFFPQMSEFCSKSSQLPNLKVLALSNLPLKPKDQNYWPTILRLFGQLDKLTIGRTSTDALLYFFNMKKEAPICIQKLYPGLANWSADVGDGHVPSGSLIGGRDDEIGHNLIVARAYHPKGDLLPGKLVASHGVCYAPWNGQEHALRRYETLVLKEDQVQWVSSSSDETVPGAVVGGMTDYGELLYVGRVVHEGSVHLGKVHRSHRVLYIAYRGLEIAHSNYETLVLKSAAAAN